MGVAENLESSYNTGIIGMEAVKDASSQER
jgi:hypothetical protein